jgi:hypothetical protein
MSILQEPPAPPLPVICDFFFEQTGPPGIATYDGDTYPYPPLPSDKGSDARYAWGTTPVFLAVEFFGTAHLVESKAQPHVIAPPGITILEYFWNFGDGHTGHGPIVTHTYEVPDPTTSISLTVLDSLGREFSTSKALSLLIVDFGYIYTRIRGQNTETPPKRQEVEASGDFALTVEGKPTRIWIARGGKKVREEEEKAVSSDRASILTHFYRSATETSLSSDTPRRQRELFRHTADTSATADVAHRNTHRFAHATDTSVSSDARPTWRYRRLIEALLGLLGKSPH